MRKKKRFEHPPLAYADRVICYVECLSSASAEIRIGDRFWFCDNGTVLFDRRHRTPRSPDPVPGQVADPDGPTPGCWETVRLGVGYVGSAVEAINTAWNYTEAYGPEGHTSRMSEPILYVAEK